MPILPILALVEFLIFFGLWNSYGFLLTIGFYFFPTLIAIYFLKLSGQKLFVHVQSLTQDPEKLDDTLFKKLVPVICLSLFIIPSMLLRALGVFLVFPLTQWLFKKWIKLWLAGQAAKGMIRVFRTQTTRVHQNEFEPQIRDVGPEPQNVIEIKPIRKSEEKI